MSSELAAMSGMHVHRVLRALRAHRTPGWQFPAHYLGIVFDELGMDYAKASMHVGSHCSDGRGDVALAALTVFADVAMAASVRERAGPAARLATVSTRLSMLPMPAQGSLEATGQAKLIENRLSMGMVVTALTVRAGDTVCCTGEATFAMMDARRVSAPHPMPRASILDTVDPLRAEDLNEAENVVLEIARNAETSEAHGQGFLERFWDLVPHCGEGWAESRLRCEMHVTNRVGDVQGGVLLGMAAHACVAALPQGWQLLDISAQFLRAASGPLLTTRAEAIRLGRNVAFVECEVIDIEANVVLRAQVTLVPGSRLLPAN